MVELIDSLSGRTVLRNFVQYLIAFCCQPEATGGVISGRFVRPVVFDKCVQFRDHRLNRFREIPPETVVRGIFDSFFRYNFRPEVDNSVVSSTAVRVDVPVKFDDSRSNGFRDIRRADLVSNERA